jgi:hypothetical protein
MRTSFLLMALVASAVATSGQTATDETLPVKSRLPSANELAGVHTQLNGHWYCERSSRSKNGIRRERLELAVTDRQVNVAFFHDTDDKAQQPYRNRVFIKEIRFVGWSAANQNQNGKHVGDACYLVDVGLGSLFVDFVGSRMIVIGKLTNRPWENFQFSGTYSRSE